MAFRDLYTEAFDYAINGLRVVWLHGISTDGACTCGNSDCPSPGKHPITRNGVLDATTNLKQLKAWSEKHPDGNIGIATGPGSNVVVVDIDPAHGGQESFEALEAEYGPLPETPTVWTGGGGTHYYLRQPEDVEIRNRAGVRPGIDVRGHNGYVSGPAREEALRIQLLEDLFEIFRDTTDRVYADGTPVTRMGSSEILIELKNRPERPWADFKSGRALTAANLASLLRPFGIRPKSMQLPGHKGLRGYDAGDFADVFKRYLGERDDS